MVGSDGDVSVIVCSDHISSWPSGQESCRLFFSLCNLQSRSRVSVTAGLKDVDRICAERLPGDGRLEDNVFMSSYSQFCQLGSCAIGEGRLKERERQSVSSLTRLWQQLSIKHATDYTFRLVLLLLRRPVVCVLQDLTRKRHFKTLQKCCCCFL